MDTKDTKQITLTYSDLNYIVFSLVMTICDTDAEGTPSLRNALSETYNKLSYIEREWRKERKKGVN